MVALTPRAVPQDAHQSDEQPPATMPANIMPAWGSGAGQMADEYARHRAGQTAEDERSLAADDD